MSKDKNNHTSTNNEQALPAVQQSPSWPSVNTSTSENIANLHISKSDEFEKIVEKFFPKP